MATETEVLMVGCRKKKMNITRISNYGKEDFEGLRIFLEPLTGTNREQQELFTRKNEEGKEGQKDT